MDDEFGLIDIEVDLEIDEDMKTKTDHKNAETEAVGRIKPLVVSDEKPEVKQESLPVTDKVTPTAATSNDIKPEIKEDCSDLVATATAPLDDIITRYYNEEDFMDDIEEPGSAGDSKGQQDTQNDR